MTAVPVCPSCGAGTGAGLSFCTNCGTSLAQAAPPTPVAPASVDATPAGAAPPLLPPPPEPSSATVAAAPPPPVAAPAPAAVAPAAAAPQAAVPVPDGLPVSTRRSFVDDLLVGEGTPNATYLGNRLLYAPGDTSFDPLTNRRYLGEMTIRALVIFLLWMVTEMVGFFVTAIVAAIIKLPALMGLFMLGSFVWSVALAAVFWLTPLPAMISEWKLTIDGKGPAASTALDHIAWVLRDRTTPVSSLLARTMSVPGQDPRVYLELRERVFAGYVSCFSFGADLYIGWTFWIYLSPVRWLWTAVMRLYHSLTLRGTSLYVNLQFDYARAVREQMHSAVRQGVDVAAGQVEASGGGTIGQFLSGDTITLAPA